MQSFRFTAKSATGEIVSDVIESDSEQNAAKAIKGQGYTPVSISRKQTFDFGLGKITNRIKTKDKILFSRQLSTLINAGLPLVQSLRNVMNQTQNKPLKQVIGRVIADVEGGAAFSASLAKYPDVFNKIFVSLVAAGEASGTLDKALERLANQQEKDAEILSKVRGAMAYPAIVLLVMVGVVGFMVVKVLPEVEKVYNDLPGASLPFVTKMLLAVSHFVTKYWWLTLILFGLFAFFGNKWVKTIGGRQFIDKVKMKAWPFGPLFMKLYMARFARTGTTLVASGLPLLQTLEITADAINNVHVANSLRRAAEKVKGGKALSDALSNDPNFLELVPNMIRIGEESGSLEEMLNKIADYYEKEVDTQIRTISTIIEPLMMIMLGAAALLIVAAILLPIYSLAGNSGFGNPTQNQNVPSSQ